MTHSNQLDQHATRTTLADLDVLFNPRNATLTHDLENSRIEFTVTFAAIHNNETLDVFDLTLTSDRLNKVPRADSRVLKAAQNDIQSHDHQATRYGTVRNDISDAQFDMLLEIAETALQSNIPDDYPHTPDDYTVERGHHAALNNTGQLTASHQTGV